MLHAPFYDPEKTYDENYEQGPFGAFAEKTVITSAGEPTYNFYGHKVYAPFGIPAGPLLNSNFCAAAFQKGFDICVYKTVRSGTFPCHPFPNVLAIHPDGDLTFEKLQKPLIADTKYTDPLSITNSFGVPSKDAVVWQADVKKAVASAGKGQVLVLSFMGTVRPDQSQEEFIDENLDTIHDKEIFSQKLADWNIYYNTKRRHHTLSNKSPLQTLIEKGEMSHMSLTYTLGRYLPYNRVKSFVKELLQFS